MHSNSAQSAHPVFQKWWVTSPPAVQTLGSGLLPQGKGKREKKKSKNAVFKEYVIRSN